MTTLPVLIVGSGPTGLYLALSLTRNGIPVRIIEKDTRFHNTSRGTGVMPRTREIQRFLGVDDAILNWGGGTDFPTLRLYKMPGATEVIKEWNLVGDVPPTPACPIGTALLVPQMAHERVMREQLANFGIVVELGKELKGLAQDSDGVTAEVIVHSAEGGPDTIEVMRAAYLCGADGARGPTRKLIGCSFLGETAEASPTLIFWNHVVRGLDQTYSHIWADKERDGGGLTVMCLPLLDGKATCTTFVIGTPGIDSLALMQPGGLATIYRKLVGRPDIQVEEPVSISTFRFSTRMVDKLQVGRVFILGDAAHVHSPSGGQGLNSSIHDAFNLGWKLGLVYKGNAPASLLSTYNEERLPVIAEMLSRTQALYKKEDLSTGSLHRGGPLFQLGVNYRWSSIVKGARKPAMASDIEELKAHAYGGHGGDHASIVAGDRAPDAPSLLDRRDGMRTSLFDLFDVTKHTILLLNPSGHKLSLTATIAALLSKLPSKDLAQLVVITRCQVDEGEVVADRVLLDSQGHACSGYNVSGEDEAILVAIRPDAYVGAIVRSVEGLEEYFSKVFLM